MTATAAQHTYTIKEAAALTGLPASTLRYYESIGVIAPVSRGASSRHRVYDEDDLDQLMWVACLAATGMSVSDMRSTSPTDSSVRRPPATRSSCCRAGAAAGGGGRAIVLRQQYVRLKIDYWQAVEAGDTARAELLSTEARALADGLRQAKKQ